MLVNNKCDVFSQKILDTTFKKMMWEEPIIWLLHQHLIILISTRNNQDQVNAIIDFYVSCWSSVFVSDTVSSSEVTGRDNREQLIAATPSSVSVPRAMSRVTVAPTPTTQSKIQQLIFNYDTVSCWHHLHEKKLIISHTLSHIINF